MNIILVLIEIKLGIMNRVLSFDISSSTIGWSILKYNKDKYILEEYGHIKPPKKEKDKTIKLSETYTLIKDLLLDKNPDEIAVEQYANKFTKGRSSANTIIVLSTYNEMVKLCCYREKNNFVINMLQLQLEVR